MKNPTQAELEAFIRRAGHSWGWLNLESAARRTAERAVVELNEQRDLLLRLADAVEALDGTSVENEKLVDDYRAWRASQPSKEIA